MSKKDKITDSMQAYPHHLIDAQLSAIQSIPGVIAKDLRQVLHDHLEVVDGMLICKIKLPASEFLQTDTVDSFILAQWGMYVPFLVGCRDLEESENFDKLILPYAIKWWDSQENMTISKTVAGKYTVYKNNMVLVEHAESLESAIILAFKAMHIPS
jgi:hypothetical protein